MSVRLYGRYMSNYFSYCACFVAFTIVKITTNPYYIYVHTYIYTVSELNVAISSIVSLQNVAISSIAYNGLTFRCTAGEPEYFD